MNMSFVLDSAVFNYR